MVVEFESKIIAIGGSAGMFVVLKEILPALPVAFPWPVVVVRHITPGAGDSIARYFEELCSLPVVEIEDKIPIQGGTIYFAPANYHLLIEEDFSFALSVDEKVNYTRPSIDVFFESVAETYRNRAVGVLLSGANADGAKGLREIKRNEGIAIVQSIESAEAPFMPGSAIEMLDPDYILEPKEMAEKLRELGNEHR